MNLVKCRSGYWCEDCCGFKAYYEDLDIDILTQELGEVKYYCKDCGDYKISEEEEEEG